MRTSFLTFTSCIAIASLTLAADQDNNKKKGQRQGGQRQQQTHALKGQRTFNPQIQGQHHGANARLHNMPEEQSKLATHNRSNTFNKTTFKNTTINNTTINKTVFKGKHFDLSGSPNPAIKSVTFNSNYRIAGSQNWRGERYVVFRDYHPVWHDRVWWVDRYPHIVFVFGGWYYWNAGYYYPAWGYAPNAYYAYDGPIYVGSYESDPGQVVANVQAALKEQTNPDGLPYYQGEVDGVLGPQTRGALADYQQAQGLEPTGAVDEPTLESLGLV